MQVLETSSRPGEGKDETGWRDSSSQLEGALQTKTKPRPPLSGECVGVWLRASMDAKRNRKAPQPNDKRRSDYWITQRYAVKPEKVDEILKIFQVEPMVDTFADEGHHVLPRWWGSNGEKADAWNETWNFSVQGYLWMNPPFDDLGRVVDKIVQDQAKAIWSVHIGQGTSGGKECRIWSSAKFGTPKAQNFSSETVSQCEEPNGESMPIWSMEQWI